MPIVYLPDRGVIRIGGAEARDWLNNLLTCDVATLTPGQGRWGALLTPQGKILIDFLITEAPAEDEGGFLLDVSRALVADFTKRLNHYYRTDWRILPPPKAGSSVSEADMKRREAELILASLEKDDFLVALDEGGQQLSSPELAAFLSARANASTRKLVFLIGGAYGLDETVLSRARFRWSLSSLTFPHQLVRLILAEQVYRACTILRNEKYHHQ